MSSGSTSKKNRYGFTCGYLEKSSQVIHFSEQEALQEIQADLATAEHRAPQRMIAITYDEWAELNALRAAIEKAVDTFRSEGNYV